MAIEYTQIQKITLTDIFNTAGLTPTRIEDVFLLLAEKPYRVQLAFYYRACGATYKTTGEMTGVHHTTAMRDIKDKCKNINNYLKGAQN